MADEKSAPSTEPTTTTTPPAEPKPKAFKCNKCGASFDDDGDMAEHAQTCRGKR